MASTLTPTLTAPEPLQPAAAPQFPAPLEVFGENPWDIAQRQQDEAKAKWFSDNRKVADEAFLDPAKAFPDIEQGFAPNIDTVRMQAANDDLMRLYQDGEDPPADEYQRYLLREKIAMEEFKGEGADTEESFFQAAKAAAMARVQESDLAKQVMDAGHVAAFTSKQVMKDGALAQEGATWPQVRQEIQGKPGYDTAKEADFMAAFYEARRAGKQVLDEFRAPLDEIWTVFQAKGPVAQIAWSTYGALKDPAEQERFLAALAIRAKSLPEEEQATFWGNFAKQAGRDLTAMPKDVGAFGVEMFQAGLADAAGGQFDGLTDQVRNAHRRQVDFMNKVVRIRDGTYDPVKTLAAEGTWAQAFEKGAYAAPGALASSAMAAVPVVGLPMFYATAREGAYQNYLQQFEGAGMSYEAARNQASNLAGAGAALEVVAEQFAIKAFAGKLPFFEQAMQGVTKRINSLAGRFAARAGATMLEEGMLEKGQDLIYPAIQEIAQALGQDVPDQQWMNGKDGILDGFWKDTAGMMVTMLPMAVIGGAGGAISDSVRVSAFQNATDRQLLALGLNPEAVSNIRMATREGVGAATVAIENGMGTLDPQSATAKAAVEQEKQDVQRQQQAQARLEQLGYAFPKVTARTDGTFSVHDGLTGEEIGQAPNLGGVESLIRNHTAAMDDMRADQVAEFATMLAAGKVIAEKTGAETVFDLGKLYTLEEAAASSPQAAERIAEELKLLEETGGGTGDMTLAVLGQHTSEVRNGIRQDVNTIFQGGHLGTVLEETAHAKWREARRRGTITREEDIALLRAFDTVLGKTGSLRFIPEGMADADITEARIEEAIGQIAQMEILRAPKGGKNKFNLPRGLVSAHLGAVGQITGKGTAFKLKSFIEALRARLAIVLDRVRAMKKAEKAGEFDRATVDAYLDKLTGTDQQRAHDDGVRTELNRILATPYDVAADDIPFSIGRSTVVPTAETRAFQGAEGSPSVIGPASFSIGAWHGTPHKVDKFSLDKIGTGEGAQAYGWGLYFADSKDVATEYRKTLSKSYGAAVDGLPAKVINQTVWEVADDVLSLGGDVDAYIKQQQLRRGDQIKVAEKAGRTDRADILRDVLNEEIAIAESLRGKEIKPYTGNLYRVELNVESEDLLDWDKPLSEQSEKVQTAIRNQMPDASWEIMKGKTGQKYYEFYWNARMAGMEGDVRSASESIYKLGIRGIRYLDGNSRNRPFKDIKRDFLNALPENAEFDDVQDAIGNGAFNPDQVAFLEALKADDWLGFDYPAQAISAALSDNINNWEPSAALIDSIKPLRGDVTYNYVIFDESAIKITEENGQPVNFSESPNSSPAFSLGRAPAVWESFPDVQWLVPFTTVSNTGGPRIKVPDAKYGERAYNRDWYVAKGKMDASTPEEQHKAARELILRIVEAAPRENREAMARFMKDHPQAELVPVRGLEAPNKHANQIPGNFARVLAGIGGQHVNETIFKTNTTHNTGKSAWDRLQQVHHFEGEVTPGAEYIIVDDISTTGATTYYLARYLAANGGIVVGSVQMGLTPRGEKNRFHQRALVGDEHVLSMSDDTKKNLQAKADAPTLNSVVQALGIAYDWRTLTDALARALASNWSRAKNLAGLSGRGAGIRESDGGGGSANQADAGSLPAFPGEREAAGGSVADQGTFAFSLGPAQVAGRMAENALKRINDPRRRAHVMSRIARDFNGLMLATERMLHLSGRRKSKAELRMEANAREDLAAEEKIGEIHARFGALLADGDLVKIKAQPVHAYLADPDTPLRGRLMSKAAAIKAHPDRYQLHRAGEYDGSDGVSRSVFGGQRLPDQAAQELYDNGLISEPTPDAMWEALLSEQKQVAGMKELLAKANEQIREAKLEAKREANEWLATQAKDQEVNFSAKEEILRSLRMLDAILLAMPAEVRGKIGGYTQMARITTDKDRLAFLKDKLAKADKELESWLRVEFDKEFTDLLRRARPDKDKPGERPSGRIAADAYDILREAENAMGLNFATGETRADMFDALADHPDTTPEDADKHRATAQMIRLTSNWHHADAARREQALIEADRIYYGGLSALAVERSRRAERLRGMQDSAIHGTGKTGHPTEIKDAKRAAKTTVKGGFKEMAYELLSFGQLANVIFGENSAVAKWLNERELAASNASFDGMQVKQDALETLMQQLAGNRFDGEKLQHRMSTQDTVKVADALGVEHHFTEAEAIQMLLEYRQEDGKRHYQGITDDAGNVLSSWSWNDANMKEIESQLTPEGQAVMAFLANSYGTEYDRINEVFRKIWNVSMPRHKMYAPIASIRPVQSKADSIMDPSTGDTMGAGMTPGSLKNRSNTAVAQPQATNAFQVYLSHARQMEHFIAYGEFARDALAIINRRDSKNAIEAAVGPNGAQTLSKWIDFFAMGGVRDANMGSRWMQVTGNALSRVMTAQLAGRVSVLAMQSLQLGAAAYKMPTGAFVVRLGKLLAGQLSWKAAIESPYIQRRLAEMPPIVRDMARGLAADKPNRAKFLFAKMGQAINGADALFTGGTYAILYDYHLTQARKLGIADPEAYAHQEAERLTDQIAQPMRSGARSWLEVSQAGNPFFRTVWNFSSDPRQKILIPVYEMIRRDVSGTEKAKGLTKALVLTWAVSGVLQAVLRAVMRDLRDDEDKEVFDERHWSLDRLALQAATGPIGGLPVIGSIIEDSTYKATGQYMPAGGIWSVFSNAVGVPRKWSKGKVDPIKDAESIASGLTLIDPTGRASFSASVLHAIRDAVGITENAVGD